VRDVGNDGGDVDDGVVAEDAELEAVEEEELQRRLLTYG
jgi:hypothetical protein